MMTQFSLYVQLILQPSLDFLQSSIWFFWLGMLKPEVQSFNVLRLKDLLYWTSDDTVCEDATPPAHSFSLF